MSFSLNKKYKQFSILIINIGLETILIIYEKKEHEKIFTKMYMSIYSFTIDIYYGLKNLKWLNFTMSLVKTYNLFIEIIIKW